MENRDLGLVWDEMPLPKAVPKDMNSWRHHNRELTAILDSLGHSQLGSQKD